MEINVSVVKYPEHVMAAIFTPGVVQGRLGPHVNDQIKVLFGEISEKLFTGLQFKQHITFKMQDNQIKDFYYIANDEQGFIFQTAP